MHERARAAATPETRLLLASVKSAWDPSASARVRALVRVPIAWDELLRRAQLHGLALFLQRALAHEEGVPELVRAQLAARARGAAAHACILSVELLQLLQALEARGIPALAVKGPALAALLYGKDACRQFGDLDLLVPRRAFLSACGVVETQGYRPYFPLPRESAAMFSRCEYAFVRGHGEAFVDLHWALFDEFFGAARDPASIWDSPASVALGGRAVRTLNATDSMLHLCVHGAGHNWRRLGWVADVARLGALIDEVQWFDVLARAERMGARRMVLLGTGIAAALFDLKAPGPIMRAVSFDRGLGAMIGKTCGRLLDPGAAHMPQSPFYYLGAMDRLRDRARVVWKRLRTPPAWVLHALPRPSATLAHVLRPIQLLRAHVLPKGRP